MKTKICSHCSKEKPINEFYKSFAPLYGGSSYCKNCIRDFTTEIFDEEQIKIENHTNTLDYEEQKIKKSEYHREYQKRNKKKLQEQKNEYRNKKRIEDKKYREKQRKYEREYQHTRRKKNIKIRLSNGFSSSIYRSLKGNKNGRKWEDIVGYTLEELKIRLEHKFQFEEGISWDNYGEWHVDHIKAVSLFNFTSYEDEEFKECWALSNLRPMWDIPNIKKGKKTKKEYRAFLKG